MRSTPAPSISETFSAGQTKGRPNLPLRIVKGRPTRASILGSLMFTSPDIADRNVIAGTERGRPSRQVCINPE
jgi:hypothetical protein